MRIRKNCTNHADYETQVEKFSGMFRDKGYRTNFLKNEKEKVGNVDRECSNMTEQQ